MDIENVYNIIHSIAEGFESAIKDCMRETTGDFADMVREQLYCGRRGDGKFLSPTYDDDDFFEERGYWYHRAAQYKAWKASITPPQNGVLLPLPPRPDNVPNLFIDGTFHREITASWRDDGVYIDPGDGNGPDIVRKYGEIILELGEEAISMYNTMHTLPAIEKLFEKSGYR